MSVCLFVSLSLSLSLALYRADLLGLEHSRGRERERDCFERRQPCISGGQRSLNSQPIQHSRYGSKSIDRPDLAAGNPDSASMIEQVLKACANPVNVPTCSRAPRRSQGARPGTAPEPRSNRKDAIKQLRSTLTSAEATSRALHLCLMVECVCLKSTCFEKYWQIAQDSSQSDNFWSSTSWAILKTTVPEQFAKQWRCYGMHPFGCAEPGHRGL